MQDTATILRNYLLYFILPLWTVLGFADYLCHRRTKIERTSGAFESTETRVTKLPSSVPSPSWAETLT